MGTKKELLTQSPLQLNRRGVLEEVAGKFVRQLQDSLYLDVTLVHRTVSVFCALVKPRVEDLWFQQLVGGSEFIIVFTRRCENCEGREI